ncbi:MAG: glycerophosphodiester phosphodiesterase [Promethearchaeota archaeon]
MDFKHPLVVAHRGFSGPDEYPENTLLAFRKAIDVGADMVEFDVHVTRDDELVICHDSDLSRTTSGQGLIRDLTLEEVRQFDAGRGERVPTLAELADLARGRVGLQLEIKATGIESLLLEILGDRGVLDQTFFSSFNHSALKKLKELNPSVRVATLESNSAWKSEKSAARGIKMFLKHARAVDAWAIHPFYFNVTPELLTAAHDEGFKVNAWTVDSAPIMADLVEMGVDGIITDFPDVALKQLGR